MVGVFITVIVVMFVVAIVVIAMAMGIFKLPFGKKDSNYEDRDGQPEVSNRNTNNPMDGKAIGDAKTFIPIKDIDGIIDNKLDLGNHNYRAVIECSSLNYFFMSAEAREITELSFQNFLNSLTFTISTYIQTRPLDVTAIIENLRQNIISAEKSFPRASGYMRQYYDYMQNLSLYIGNNKVKKKYIIVQFDGAELEGLSALDNSELQGYAFSELDNRCAIVVNGLANLGIAAKILDNDELAECIYAYAHRESATIAKEIDAGYYDTLAINGDREVYTDKDMLLKSILNDTQNRMDIQLRSTRCTDEQDHIYSYINSVLEYLKNRVDTEEGRAELINVSSGQTKGDSD
jgi:hypothetical protein